MVRGEKKEFLHVKINLPSFQFEVYTKDPSTALVELRKLLETVKVDDDVVYEEFVVQEMRQVLSETFVGNTQVMSAVRRLLKSEDDYRLARVDISATATIDLENQTREVRLQRMNVKRAITKLIGDIDVGSVKQGIIHINGDIENEDKLLIVDHIHKTMPTAQLRAFQSPSSSQGNQGNVVVECIFFGDFPEDDE